MMIAKCLITIIICFGKRVAQSSHRIRRHSLFSGGSTHGSTVFCAVNISPTFPSQRQSAEKVKALKQSGRNQHTPLTLIETNIFYEPSSELPSEIMTNVAAWQAMGSFAFEPQSKQGVKTIIQCRGRNSQCLPSAPGIRNGHIKVRNKRCE